MPQIFIYALKHVKDLHGEKHVMKGSCVLKTCLKGFTIVKHVKQGLYVMKHVEKDLNMH